VKIKQLVLSVFTKRRMTILEISKAADIEWPTAEKALDELKMLGIVEETITTASTRVFKLSESGEKLVKNAFL